MTIRPIKLDGILTRLYAKAKRNRLIGCECHIHIINVRIYKFLDLIDYPYWHWKAEIKELWNLDIQTTTSRILAVLCHTKVDMSRLRTAVYQANIRIELYAIKQVSWEFIPLCTRSVLDSLAILHYFSVLAITWISSNSAIGLCLQLHIAYRTQLHVEFLQSRSIKVGIIHHFANAQVLRHWHHEWNRLAIAIQHNLAIHEGNCVRVVGKG